jgi:hypothetical protein
VAEKLQWQVAAMHAPNKKPANLAARGRSPKPDQLWRRFLNWVMAATGRTAYRLLIGCQCYSVPRRTRFQDAPPTGIRRTDHEDILSAQPCANLYSSSGT